MSPDNSFSKKASRPWVVAQIGARRHYLIPRELHRRGRLRALVTDAWMSSSSWIGQMPLPALRRLRERYHPNLDNASVYSFTSRWFAYEIEARLRGFSGWDRMIRRNTWFQERTVHLLRNQQLLTANGEAIPPTVFCFSYAALDIFKLARDAGCITVLGQMNAGPYEAKLVADQHAKYPEFERNYPEAPASYWGRWYEECELADCIVVNSAWSKAALSKAGVKGDKVQVVPLGYEHSGHRLADHNSYPQRFSRDRPLRVLYLGSLTLRKGVAELLEAARRLQHDPVEFWMVGGTLVHVPEHFERLPNVRWIGPVPRGATAGYYQAADVFVLPTISDGFALTQLEALSHGLPLVVSKRCGDVVVPGQNGIQLEDVTPEAIETSIRWCLHNPHELSLMSTAAAATLEQFRPATVIDTLHERVDLVAGSR